MSIFDQQYEEWLHKQINEETNPRRRQLLNKGLGHGTVEFLRSIWHPAIGHLNHLYPEWEVRDLDGKLRYLDIAYMPPPGVKGCIEIHGYRSHARDVDVTRFKDLCMKQAMLALDDWVFLPIAYLSIEEDPERCKQLVLSFAGKFLSTQAPSDLNWAEAEALRFARRLLRPFMPAELAAHLRLSDRHTRRLLHDLVNRGLLLVSSGNLRYRTYQIRMSGGLL
ncbi:transcriptional regulator [Paenibacillus thermotolerans]|uniref:transcriptional regulator n=1 Tax=Paenibacillus thermotolerans TaxID=3027807 RepID=UPI0023677819|nr:MULTISPECIES: transcriptional regulator [unclassified Paenibacillus]